MIETEILQPVVALAAWTMVMWLWMYVVRLPAMKAAKVDINKLANDGTVTLDDLLPAKAQWPAKNYNHLHEAPTVFYAVCLILALTGNGGGHGSEIAWAYVGLRVLHSLVQASINRINLRFILFALSTTCLAALVYRAGQVVFMAV